MKRLVLLPLLLSGCASNLHINADQSFTSNTFYCVEGDNRVTGTYTTQRANQYGRVIFGTRYKINNGDWLTASSLVVFGGYCAFGVRPEWSDS